MLNHQGHQIQTISLQLIQRLIIYKGNKRYMVHKSNISSNQIINNKEVKVRIMCSLTFIKSKENNTNKEGRNLLIKTTKWHCVNIFQSMDGVAMIVAAHMHMALKNYNSMRITPEHKCKNIIILLRRCPLMHRRPLMNILPRLGKYMLTHLIK